MTVFSAAVDAGLGWLAVVMALNVVVALYYYLQWTTVLFRTPEPAAATEPAPAAGAAITRPRAVPLTAAIALTAAAGIALSGAPQLVLRFASSTLL